MLKKEKRYERTGKSGRKIITLFGELDLKVDKIRDKLTGNIFKSLLLTLGIKPYKTIK